MYIICSEQVPSCLSDSSPLAVTSLPDLGVLPSEACQWFRRAEETRVETMETPKAMQLVLGHPVALPTPPRLTSSHFLLSRLLIGHVGKQEASKISRSHRYPLEVEETMRLREVLN